MVIWNDLVWAKTGDDVPALRPSAGSDCLGINAVVTVQVSPYQSLDAQNKKPNKNISDQKFHPPKATFVKEARTAGFSIFPSMNKWREKALGSRVCVLYLANGKTGPT